MRKLVDEIIKKYQLKTIQDVLTLIPQYMCHITQESEVFETYNPLTIQLSRPEHEWVKYEEIYKHYAETVIPSLSLENYLINFLEFKYRLPCFCSEIGDVAGILLARVLEQRVYVIRRTFVNYLSQPTRRHCLNAIVENKKIRYIDAAVYNQIVNMYAKKLIHPSQLPNFDASDISDEFLKSPNWLHTEPFQRQIYLENDRIVDTFYPNPDPDGLIDEYQHVYSFVEEAHESENDELAPNAMKELAHDK